MKSLLLLVVFVISAKVFGQVPTSGLVAYYPFNGNANDESGYGNNATVLGATQTGDRFGKTNSALYFTDDAYDTATVPVQLQVSKVTLCAWVKITSLGEADAVGQSVNIVSIRPLTRGQGTYSMSVFEETQSPDSLRVEFSASNLSNGSLASTSSLSLDKCWHFLCVAYDGANIAVYIDSRLAGLANSTGDLGPDPEATLIIGRNSVSGPTPLGVIIDDIRIYDRALNGDEILGAAGLSLGLKSDNDAVHLSWMEGLGFIPLRYRIYRVENSSAPILLDSVAGTQLIYTDHSPMLGAIYRYKVAAVDSNLVERAMSNEAQSLVHIPPPSHVAIQTNRDSVCTGLSLVGDSTLYAIASGDAIYKMDFSGDIDYTLEVGGSVRSSSSTSRDSVVYIASSDRNLYSFSRYGAPVWPALPLGGELSVTPTVDETANQIYLGVENKNFIAVNRTTGLVTWSFFADAPIRSSAVITSDRMLVFATVVGTIYAVDLNDLIGGVPKHYTVSAGNSILASPSVDLTGAIYYATRHGKSIKVRVESGVGVYLGWQIHQGHPVVASTVIDGRGNLFVASLDSTISAMDISTGSVKWSFLTGGAFRSTPAISPSGTLYVGNDAGEVAAFDSTGHELWYYRDSSAITSPLLLNGNRLFAGTSTGKVLVFSNDGLGALAKVTAQALPAWGTFQGNNHRTGNQADARALSVNSNTSNVPSTCELFQNYPNPFNPTTTIRYGLPHRSHVLLTVYNTLGQKVNELVNRDIDAGYHEVQFDARNLSSGVYFYRLQAGSYVKTMRLLLLR